MNTVLSSARLTNPKYPRNEETMKASELIYKIEKTGELDGLFAGLYGKEAVGTQKKRYAEAAGEFIKRFGDGEVSVFSVPGRSEILGNHTDHQRGRVIAAAVNLDIIAIAEKTDSDTTTVVSRGFEPDVVPAVPGKPSPEGYYRSSALISGMADGLLKRGYKISAFNAYTTSDVFKGSGLSSSAAFEVMIGTIQNHFANGGKISAPVIAEIAKYSENVWFNKPSGLMDQTACSVGGFCFIDFEDPSAAKIKKLGFSLSDAGYRLCITNTGGNHADLNDDYSSVPAEMKKVAALFGADVLRGVTADELIGKAAEIRQKCGDRAFLRAYHFINENERVGQAADLLGSGDFPGFLKCIGNSGNSSFKWLQNVYTPKNVGEQGLSLALAVSEHVLKGSPRPTASRVHGGGFAGTIQAFVPDEYVSEYKKTLESVFGPDSVYVLNVRKDGAVKLI